MPSVADTEWVITQARQVGFDLCGVAQIDETWTDVDHLAEWLSRGYAGEMRYLADPRRGHPQRAMPEARSVIVCAINYNADRPYSIHAHGAASAAKNDAPSPAKDGVPKDDGPRGWLARYAWGDDYHDAVSEKLHALVAALRGRFGADFVARPYVDTGPVVERAAARDAGLGWLGKNTCLINDEIGSWLFLGVILTSLALPAAEDLPVAGELSSIETPASGISEARKDAPIIPTPPPDLCGNCTLCLDACPTGALVEPYVLDARRCISYLTIELRGAIPEELRSAMGWQVFGCDICQDVCPWNRTAPATPVAAFQPRDNLFTPDLAWVLSLTQEQFSATFRGSAVKRAKWRGLVRNACIAAGNAAPLLDPPQRQQLRARLQTVVASGDAVLAEHARWALDRLKPGD
jgi:epoxyqueuosine reductase